MTILLSTFSIKRANQFLFSNIFINILAHHTTGDNELTGKIPNVIGMLKNLYLLDLGKRGIS